MAIITVAGVISVPIQLEKTEATTRKMDSKRIAGFCTVGTHAYKRQMSPSGGDGGFGGDPDDHDDTDGRDDDDTIDMIDRAKNHLDAMSDEDSTAAADMRLMKAHELLSQAIAKRRGKASPHSVKFV
jgi:hypothetical protein